MPLKHTKQCPTCGNDRVMYLNREGHVWASCRTTGNPLDKAVLVFIGGRMNKHWAAFPGKAEIAHATEIAESTVVKCIRRLERGGHLVRVAFAATNGADQKIGYVLAGCGRPLDDLDDDFLALAFADRKQPGVPRTVKPQHWSGEQKGGRVAHSHPPRVAHSHPEGAAQPPLEEKNNTEDHQEQEEAFGEAAVPAAQQDQEQAAIAEARAGALASVTENQGEEGVRIPAQRQQRDRRSAIRKRDDDWTVQIAAADLDSLKDAIDYYEVSQGGLWTWAQKAAGLDAGLLPDEEWTRAEDQEDHFRASYLRLLKKHAGDDWRFHLAEPLDGRIESQVPDYEWIEYCPAPDGLSREEFAKRMADVVRNTPPDELGPMGAEMRRIRSKVWVDCWNEAKQRLKNRKRTADLVSINGTAILVAIEHYLKLGSDWPAAIVPPSLRTAFPVQSAPPAWAA